MQSRRKRKDTEIGVRVQQQIRPDAAEYRMIKMMERADKFQDYRHHFERLKKGSLDVPAFFGELSHEAMVVMIESMRAEDPRLAFDAAKDVLDRAGHGKTQKIAVGHVHVDHQTSKRELINMIMSSAKKAGLDVKDEEHVQGQLEGSCEGDVIDVPHELSNAPAGLGHHAEDSLQVSKQTKDFKRDD